MLSKTFVFTKIQKTTEKIENDINAFLAEHEFKLATQNESTSKGKFIVTIFAVAGKSTIKVKAFKDQHIDALDKKVNLFLKKNPMRFATQTFVGSSVYTIIFYDSAPKTVTTTPTGNDSNGTN